MQRQATTRVVIALVAALAIGIVIATTHSAAGLRAVGLVEPIGTLWVNAIRMTVLPLVVALLVSGIASIADAAAVGRSGARTLVTFILLLVASSMFALLVCPLLYSFAPAASAARASLLQGTELPAAAPSIREWIVGLVPANPVKAAADGTMLPLVIFGVLTGLAATKLEERRRAALTDVAQAIADAMLVIVKWAIALAPIGVFALVLPTTVRLGPSVVGDVGVYAVVFAASCVLFGIALYVIVWLVARVSVPTFAKAALPPQAVAIASSSSLASLPALIESAEHRLRLHPIGANFVLPLAVALFKVAAPITWIVGALFVSRLSGVSLGPGELLTVALTAVATSFSTPGVPHGGFLLMVPLLTSLGLPAAGVGLLIAVDAIPDLFATALNVTGDLSAATIVSRWEARGAPPTNHDITAAADLPHHSSASSILAPPDALRPHPAREHSAPR